MKNEKALYMSINTSDDLDLYKIAKAKQIIRIADHKIITVMLWNSLKTIGYDIGEQQERILSLKRAKERLENYCRQQYINLLIQKI